MLKITVLLLMSLISCTDTKMARDRFSDLPGGQPIDDKALTAFMKAKKNRGPAYKPRTRHLKADSSALFTNRLFLESSPYLLQHAHNPVNWYPWNDEAFETAKQLKRPVFLSVGYSTCHWCHVMEEESFENLEVAKFLNENYVAIKVDREERPDIDAIYMSAVQALTGRGGWPMTVVLGSDRKPFFGGTYFPPEQLTALLQQLKTTYDQEPTKVAEAAKRITEAIQNRFGEKPTGSLPTAQVLQEAIQFYKSRFDTENGGLMGAPKFPSTLPIRFLLREYQRTGDGQLLKMATLTLKKMAASGIYDQVGGGFHRYSTDADWLVPHFEKMLYDNALLTLGYLEAFQVTGDKEFERIVREILRYVERDMTSPEGAFYSATDADSKDSGGHSHEGYFFTWTPAEIEDVLGAPASKLALVNFENRNILTRSPKDQLNHEALEKLYEARNRRARPGRDEKILTAWNGLMISAFARSGFVLADKNYVQRASTAAEFVLKNLRKNKQLYRSYKDGHAKHMAYLDDYAFLIAGLLDLYGATSSIKWLKSAIELDQTLQAEYEDREGGGFFMTGSQHEKLITRQKPAYDGAEPSGNSVAVLNLVRLGALTTDNAYQKRAEKALQAFSPILSSQPIALSELLLAVEFTLATPKEIAIVTPAGQTAKAEPFLSELRKKFMPYSAVVVLPEGTILEEHAKVVPWVRGKIAQRGQVTAYVCEKGICKLPTTDLKVFAGLISK